MANLLMIDDNPQSQQYLARIIRLRTPHRLAFASDGRQAIERLVEQRPDLIFLDLYVPGTDGFQFFEVLRRHPATADIPIVIHTAVPLDPIAQIRMRRVRCDGFLEFPVEATALTRLLDRLLLHPDAPVKKWVPPSV